MKLKLLLFTIPLFLGSLGVKGQIATFNFPASNSTVVTAKDTNVTVSNITLSAGTIETNITTGTYFPNEPYIEETANWTGATQDAAKNFTFTITPTSGYVINITNISFRSYTTAAGPSAVGFGIGSTDIYSTNSPDSTLLVINQAVAGQNNLSSAVIKIQGWLNGSRTSSGAGVFRLDDVVITGTVTPTCTDPSLAFATASFSKNIGDANFTPTAPTTNSAGAITYSSNNTFAATVNSTTGEVTVVGVGTAIITASQVANGIYCLDTATYTVDVISTSPTISTTGTLTTLPTTYGTASSSTTFTVSAANLIADLIITPPSGFEVSIVAGSGFTTSLNLGTSNRTNTTIYVRLAATTAFGTYSGNISLASTGATTATIETASSTVTRKVLTVSGFSGVNKVYDRLTTATLSGTGTLVGVVGGDIVTLSGTATVTFVDKTVATGKTISIAGLSLAGANAGNYTLTAPTATANITAKPLTVTGATASNKIYDRTTIATITGSTLAGVVSGDTVTINGTGNFNNANVGTGKTVTSTQVLAGADAANYTVTLPTGLTANITAKALTITGLTASNKAFDGNTTATLTGTAALSGVVSGDGGNVTLGGTPEASFADATIATGKAVTVSGYTLSGSASGNYSLTQPTGLTANITANSNSDIIAVTSSEAATISSLINTATISTSVQGTQVWQFSIRDGGGAGDADDLESIVTALIFAQAAGNALGTWSDAIQSIALFDGTTFIANGTVNATQISFTGLNINVADNTSKTISVRLSLKNPLGADAFDGEDFVFSLSNANATFSPSGSGKSSFSAATSTNGSNLIEVIATKLVFTTQPTNTAINSGMNAVVVRAYDANNNLDLGYTGSINLTSSGTENTIPAVAATAGSASFSGITHTALGTGLILTAAASGLTNGTSDTFNIVVSTNLTPGDLAILAVNTIGSSGDQIAFVVFTDIIANTKLFITDNGYERKTAGQWGNTEGVITITRTGATLPKGTIVVIEATGDININEGTDFNIFVCGVNDNSNWTRDFEGGGSGFNLSDDDDIYIMQGGTWNDGSTTSHDATYSGTVLYAWTESGWDVAPGGDSNQSPAWSTLFPFSVCYSTTSPSGPGKLKFDDPINPDFSATDRTKLDWIGLINDTSNWDSYSDNATYNAGGYNYKGATTCPALTIEAGSDIAYWEGSSGTNWFDCSNWSNRVVPNATVDVVLDNTNATQAVIILATAPNANTYSGIAQCKNLTLSDEKVTIASSANNKLEVHGNLSIASGGELDMSDGNDATNDGQLYLYGNWSNYLETAFKQGNSTVHFLGSSPQTVTCSSGGPETFYNVNLANANNFTTDSFNSDLKAEGSLELSNGCDLIIKTGHYALSAKNLTVGANSVLTIENKGSLIQTDDIIKTVTNNGTINALKTTTPFEKFDYTYWSTPMTSTTIATTFAGWRTEKAYEFLTANFADANLDGYDDNGDDWSFATTMTPGKGYIIMGDSSGTFPKTSTVTFTGTVNNGINTATVALTPNGLSDDDWNLVGNPYPSAISADAFINANLVGTGTINKTIDGTLYFWTHKADIGIGSVGVNYTQDDYAMYNLTGGVGVGTAATSTTGSNDPAVNSVPAGFIASGQGFFVEAAAAGDVTFNNSMRQLIPDYSNNQFYKTTPASKKAATKDRIWLNMTNAQDMFSQQLIGYFDNATLGYDNGYDGLLNDGGNSINFYSVMETNNYKIQARPTFDANDQVQLGYFAGIAGDFTISIDHKEGVFESSTNIYLEDKLLGLVRDLKATTYTFTTTAGTFNDRFVLRYTDKTLGTDDFDALENQVLVSYKNKQLKVTSKLKSIDKVTVYDLLGRQFFKKEKVNSNEFSLSNWVANQQVVIVKVRLQNGNELTKKVMF